MVIFGDFEFQVLAMQSNQNFNLISIKIHPTPQ